MIEVKDSGNGLVIQNKKGDKIIVRDTDHGIEVQNLSAKGTFQVVYEDKERKGVVLFTDTDGPKSMGLLEKYRLLIHGS